jgi:hypothetical protein
MLLQKPIRALLGRRSFATIIRASLGSHPGFIQIKLQTIILLRKPIRAKLGRRGEATRIELIL